MRVKTTDLAVGDRVRTRAVTPTVVTNTVKGGSWREIESITVASTSPDKRVLSFTDARYAAAAVDAWWEVDR